MGVVGIGGARYHDTAAAAGMNEEKGIASPYLCHYPYMPYARAYPAAREEHQVTGAYLAEIDGNILGILVTRRAPYEDAVQAIDVTREP